VKGSDLDELNVFMMPFITNSYPKYIEAIMRYLVII